MPARPGIERHRRLTRGAFWPGGLIPRFPPPDSFALPVAAFWCPSIYRVAHGLPPIVCFAWVQIFPRAYAPVQLAAYRFAYLQLAYHRYSPVAARWQCWLTLQTWPALGISSQPALIWLPGFVPALSKQAPRKV